MSDQKKTSTRKVPGRKSAAKTVGTHSARTRAAADAPPPPKTRARRSKAAARPAEIAGIASLFDAQLPAEMRAAIEAAEAAAPAAGSLPVSAVSDPMSVPASQLLETGAAQARETYVQARTAGESLRQAMTETAHASTRGALEVNGKVVEALRAQSDVAFDLWRAALKTSSFSDAISLQTMGARQVFETAANHWADVAESTRRWLGATVEPLQSAWTGRTR